MIPYDDLVAALTTWRARQGLPVAGAAPSPVPMTGSGPAPASGPTAAPGSGPTAKPGSGPNRGSMPPSPPPGKSGSHGMYQPTPLAQPDTQDDSLDVDDSALLEESHFDNEGDDFEMKFGALENDAESTTLGQAPADRDSFGGETELDPKAKSKKPW
jgi:hypothetical protein